jgi:outer membrane protein assembly factor BamE (lipoprotein component of BamABCDE complex)
MKWILFAMTLLVLAGCASYSGENGVENIWRSENAPEWKVGVTTEQDVADILGPPSQLIALQDQSVYYYLRERRSGKAIVLLVFNWGHQQLTYDRAVFFFDKKGILTKYAYSPEALPYEEPK